MKMKNTSLRLLSLCALMTTSVCAFGQLSFSGTNPPGNSWINEGMPWKVVDDEGGKAIEFRNENPNDFINIQAPMDYVFAETLSKKGFVLRNKIKILSSPEGTNFSYSMNIPSLTGIGLGFFSRAGSTNGILSIGSFDVTQEKHINGLVENAFNRYLNLEAKFVPDSTGGKLTVSVDGKELYSINISANEKQRYDFNIISGKKDNTAAKAIFLIKDFEVKPL